MVRYLVKPNLWFGLVGQYQHRKIESKSTGRDPRESQDEFWTLNLSNTWVSKNQEISFQQILDNYHRYYGQQLEGGTFVLNNRVGYQKSEFNDRVQKNISFLNDIQFFVLKNLFISSNINLHRSSSAIHRMIINGNGNEEEFRHQQRYNIIAEIAYQSFTWDQNKRRDISWQDVSDIDYLLGAMLRPGDYKLSLMIDFPDNNWSFASEDDKLFNFFEGDFNDNWKITTSGSIGICQKVQAGVELSWNQYEVFDHIFMPLLENDENYVDIAHNWRLIPQVSVQPTDYLRLHAKITEIFNNGPYYGYYYPETTYDVIPYLEDNDHDWRVEFVVDLVI